ncbi:hypothetical protein COO60DRAFT_1540851 [Scenedesmus sp. NREL 46B-D3]|nr:hypothetical protein COO60DRAFT_1540851 [Scenedesmus sp. NREL 46B-D3]
MVGLNFAQILQQGLGLDLDNPQVWTMPEERLQSMQGISADKYHSIITSDAALSGDCWIFDYWSNSASLAPAPFAKFGTCQLKALLTPEDVLGSLENGVWGRAMLAAAAEAGLTPHVPAQKKVAVTAGAGSVGGASAWLYLQAQLAETMQQDGGQKVRHLALAGRWWPLWLCCRSSSSCSSKCAGAGSTVWLQCTVQARCKLGLVVVYGGSWCGRVRSAAGVSTDFASNL